jgi:hypothetical protein
MRKVTGRMSLISVNSIDYRILCDAKAAIHSCHKSVTALLPRNCVIVHGARIAVTHLLTAALAHNANTLLIPHSLHTISSSIHPVTRKLQYLVFESGTELHSIGSSASTGCLLKSLFLPPLSILLVQVPLRN